MADSIKIEVETKEGSNQTSDKNIAQTLKEVLESNFEKLKASFETAKEKGATKEVEGSERDFEALSQSLEQLLKIANPSAAILNDIVAQFKGLADIIIKLGKAIDPTTEQAEKLVEAETELAKKRDLAVKEAAEAGKNLSKKGTGLYGLKDDYVKDQIKTKAADFTYTSGPAKGKVASVKAVKEMASEGDFSKVANPEEAKKFFDELVAQETKLVEELLDAREKIRSADAEHASLDKTNKDTGFSLGDKMVIDANTTVANVKTAVAQDKVKDTNPDKGPQEAGKSLQEVGGASKPKNTLLNKAKQLFTLAQAYKVVRMAWNEAKKTVTELDKYLTEQAMVTGKTRKETYALVGAYQELARSTGATTKEVAQVSTEYMKQGKSTQEALVLTEAAISAAKVARVEVGASVDYLTTALNGFQLAASDAMRVSDVFAAVAATSATDYDELAIALSKVASQANLAGMSMEYTTALLTKGLETTREAPETMGTALKTIIARMREMKDYGSTLEGDTDVNNVESQLAYVGIALKDEQGELRSTQEVLDELGRKWDSLNKNQQAAIAKALAGTRQQSRLIAMMSDYERVIELQETAERSQGATSAQAEVYLEGMEAAMNNVKVAWEQLVMSLTQSEVVIGIINTVATVIDGVGSALTNINLLLPLLSAGALGILMSMIAQAGIAKKTKESEERRLALQRKADAQAKKKAAFEKLQDALRVLRDKKEKKRKLEKNKIVLEGLIAETTDEAKKLKLQKELAKTERSIQKTNEEIREAKHDVAAANQEMAVANGEILATSMELNASAGLFGKILNGALAVLMPILGIMRMIFWIQERTNRSKKKGIALTKGETAAKKKGLFASVAEMFTSVVSAFSTDPITALVGVALATALAAAVGVGIAAAAGAFTPKQSGADKAADEVNALSNQIYKLNEKANALNQVQNQFDAIDKKVIKTSKDIEEMNSLLDSAGDKLDSTNETDSKGKEIEGTSEKDTYNALEDPVTKRKFLENSEKSARAKANELRQEQLDIVNGLNSTDRAELLDDKTSNAKHLKAQSAIRAIANNTVFEEIDALKEKGIYSNEELRNTEKLTRAILDQVDAATALEYANNPERTRHMVNELQKLDATQDFMDESKSVAERIEAYKAVSGALKGDRDAYEAFTKAYQEWDTFAKMDESVIRFIDATHMSIDQINKVYGAYDKLQKLGLEVTEEVYKDRVTDMMGQMNGDLSNFEAVLKESFGDILNEAEDFDEAWNTLVSAIGDQFAVGVLDMGQHMEKFKNNINSFYEKAAEWNNLKDSEKAQFISDNAKLFNDEGGEKLLQAFESGNFDDIEQALNNQLGVIDPNDDKYTERERMMDEVNRTLAVEEARRGEDRNEAYIAQLKEYKSFLQDGTNLFKANLEMRLEQESKHLEEYKHFLKAQQEELTKSLEKRKEAYQKYFDSINNEEEEEDYEEKANTLVTNISKLGSTHNADAQNQKADLEQQLRDLEEDRLKTLREQAQEKVMENLDTEVEEINEKFDKLLESNRELLKVMSEDMKNPAEFLTDLITTKAKEGGTTMEMQKYLQDLQGTYGDVLGNEVFENIKVHEENGNMYLTVNGEEIALSGEDEQSVFTAIMQALRQVGLK